MFDKILRLFTPRPDVSSYSIQGRKTSQEDNYYISKEKPETRFIFVADGVGGHKHGEYASQICVDIFSNTFKAASSFVDIPDFLRKTGLVVAASIINKGSQEPDYKNSGTTISGFFVSGNSYYTINTGDSRVYQYSSEILIRKTKDHSKVQRLIDAGIITEEEAFTHPERNIMTSALGQSLDMLNIDIDGPVEIKNGDIMLAFTDGVHDALRDNEIAEIIEKNKRNSDLAKIIVNKAYNAGGTDNITACVYWHNLST